MREALESMASAAATGTGECQEAWKDVTDGLMDQGTVYEGAYAAVPYLVDVAAELPAERFVDLWVDLGFLLTAEDRRPVPADLETGFDAATRVAEQAAVRSFLAGGIPASVCAQLALSCVAFAGHHAAEVLWRFLDPRDGDIGLYCPGCGYDTELPGFLVDPVSPPCEPPTLPDSARARQGGHPWGEVAAALREEALGEGWESFLRVARAVAEAGVPRETPGQAVLCLVAAMVAVKGTPGWAGRRWARTLMLLTGHFCCPGCEETWTIADGLAEDPGGAHPRTVAEQTRQAAHEAAAAEQSAGPRRTAGEQSGPRRDGRTALAADGTPRHCVEAFADCAPGSGDGVTALAVIYPPGRPALVAGAGDRGLLRLWDLASGRLHHGPLPGHPDPVRSMTALPLPGGRTLLASGGDNGTIGLWDAITGQPVHEPAGNWLGAVTGMCTATVPDGRTLLVTATSRGSVRLREPLTGESVARLNPSGRPIESITAIPVSADHTLIAACDPQGGVHVWDPAVDDPWEPGAAVPLSKRALEDFGHRPALVTAAPLHGRTLLATGDRNGAVMLWDPATGTPVGDGLPPDTAGSPLTAMTATAPHSRHGIVVTGSKQGGSVRVWEPETGKVQRIALDVPLTCLAAAGLDVIVGHDHGALRLSLGPRHRGADTRSVPQEHLSDPTA
ncbi:hypothetical protein JK359_16365 [Streptomyces actinomycinicus]|uniref:WD40 repeat domain-containing protein n=1 Tax=Streptomyces actinomycinicus TaxID=1695166 RepID=A0A937JLE6_9ACTN|nr:hypothetical protein [Streptomyces actinomycinicus]